MQNTPAPKALPQVPPTRTANWSTRYLYNPSLPNSTVIISNHYNDITKELYKNCSEYYIKEVRRSISAKSENRGTVKEIIAVFA